MYDAVANGGDAVSTTFYFIPEFDVLFSRCSDISLFMV